MPKCLWLPVQVRWKQWLAFVQLYKKTIRNLFLARHGDLHFRIFLLLLQYYSNWLLSSPLFLTTGSFVHLVSSSIKIHSLWWSENTPAFSAHKHQRYGTRTSSNPFGILFSYAVRLLLKGTRSANPRTMTNLVALCHEVISLDVLLSDSHRRTIREPIEMSGHFIWSFTMGKYNRLPSLVLTILDFAWNKPVQNSLQSRHFQGVIIESWFRIKSTLHLKCFLSFMRSAAYLNVYSEDEICLI